jgi:hypothetical protein
MTRRLKGGFIMRFSVTVGQKEDGSLGIIAGPGFDVQEQKELMNKMAESGGEHKGTKYVKGYILTRSGTMKRRSFKEKYNTAPPPKPSKKEKSAKK